MFFFRERGSIGEDIRDSRANREPIREDRPTKGPPVDTLVGPLVPLVG